MIVHRPGHVSCAADFGLGGQDTRGGEEEGGGWRRAETEGEGAVRADGDAGWDWGSRVVVCCAGIKFLHCLRQRFCSVGPGA